MQSLSLSPIVPTLARTLHGSMEAIEAVAVVEHDRAELRFEGDEILSRFCGYAAMMLNVDRDEPDLPRDIEVRLPDTAIIAERWDYVVVAVAMPMSHPQRKSLRRKLRAVRKAWEKAKAKEATSTPGTAHASSNP